MQVHFNQEQTQTKQAHYSSLFFFVFQSRLREMVEYDDLAELQARELPSLKIADSSKFSQGLIPAVPKVSKIVNNGRKQKYRSLYLSTFSTGQPHSV